MVLAGSKARASDIRPVKVISKAVAETVTSSTALQDDDDFSIDLEVGKSYVVRAYLSVTGATGGDVKVAWSNGATVTKSSRHCLGPQTGTTDATNTAMRSTRHGIASSVPYGVDGTNESAVFETLQIEDVTVAGTLTMQWAQNASSGTATTMGTTSRIEWVEVDLQ